MDYANHLSTVVLHSTTNTDFENRYEGNVRSAAVRRTKRYEFIDRPEVSNKINDFKTVALRSDKFVDKTLLIKTLVGASFWYSSVVLILRPRRWGKSFDLSMLRTFFEVEIDEDGNPPLPTTNRDGDKCFNRFLFYGGTFRMEGTRTQSFRRLNIANYTRIMNRYQGYYPVIWLELKEVVGDNVFEFAASLAKQIAKAYSRHDYLTRVYNARNVKRKFAECLAANITRSKLKASLIFLSDLLRFYFERRVLLLVDDYDAPIIRAYDKFGNSNEFSKVERLFRQFFSFLRENEVHVAGNGSLYRTIMTGVVAIPIGINFVDTKGTLIDFRYKKFYGFNYTELQRLYNFADPRERSQLKQWYAGHPSDQTYNPWSVMEFFKNQTSKYRNYWPDAVPSNFVENILNDNSTLQLVSDLCKSVDGHAKSNNRPFVVFRLKRVIVLRKIFQQRRNQQWRDNFLSYLFYNGYLKLQAENSNGSSFRAIVANYEIRNIIRRWIEAKNNCGQTRIARKNSHSRQTITTTRAGHKKSVGEEITTSHY